MISMINSLARSRAVPKYYARRRKQAESREDLVTKLKGPHKQVECSLQPSKKFMPTAESGGPLSDRHNIVVIADERTVANMNFIDGYARHMRDSLPNASFIGFMERPSSITDATLAAYLAITSVLRYPASGRRRSHGQDLL
jgi:type I restriction enzyme R subunit